MKSGDQYELLINKSRTLPENGGLTTGIMVEGNDSIEVLIKAEGEILGRNDVLSDPLLILTTMDGIELARNNFWCDHPTAARVAQLTPPASDREAAFVITLEPGIYPAQLKSADQNSGLGLLAVSDVRLFAE